MIFLRLQGGWDVASLSPSLGSDSREAWLSGSPWRLIPQPFPLRKFFRI